MMGVWHLCECVLRCVCVEDMGKNCHPDAVIKRDKSEKRAFVQRKEKCERERMGHKYTIESTCNQNVRSSMRERERQ